MPHHKKVIAGHQVEIWETSFRLEGMARTIHVGHHITDDAIEQIITTIHEAVAEKAEQDGKQRALDAITRRMSTLIMGETR